MPREKKRSLSGRERAGFIERNFTANTKCYEKE